MSMTFNLVESLVLAYAMADDATINNEGHPSFPYEKFVGGEEELCGPVCLVKRYHYRLMREFECYQQLLDSGLKFRAQWLIVREHHKLLKSVLQDFRLVIE